MRIVFFGTPDFSLPFLHALAHDDAFDVVAVVTQPDKPAGRGRILQEPPVKTWALAHKIGVFQFPSLKTTKARAVLSDLGADAYVVVAYGKIIPPEVLSLPSLGCVNVHPSMLPKYRGPAPMQAAIENGDSATGISIMLLDAGMDTGPILAQQSIELSPAETLPSLVGKIHRDAPRFLVRTLREYGSKQIQPKPQDESRATTTRLLAREDGKIDWSRPVEEIDRKIRAYSPWPGIWTTWKRPEKSLRMKILEAKPAELTDRSAAAAGHVLNASGKALIVKTGKGSLAVTSIQFENAKAMTIRDALNGHPGLSQAVFA